MRITFLAVGKRHDIAIAKAVDDYSARLRKYCKLQWVIVPSPKAALSPAEQKRIESEALLAKIPPQAAMILLDERGAELTTLAFAHEVAQLREQSKEIIFVIGGAYGVSDTLRSRAVRVIALSQLTFPHQLVRVILAEQAYRVFTILNNEPYHHD